MILVNRKKLKALLLLLTAILLCVSCGPKPTGEKGTEIVSAKEAMELIQDSGTVIVDAQPSVNYRKRHVDGAVSIPRPAINVSEPFPNLLAPAEAIEAVMQEAGINSTSQVVIYDDNKNMDSARLWWTLKAYGHEGVKVVSGGLQALASEGALVNNKEVSVAEGNFKAGFLNECLV